MATGIELYQSRGKWGYRFRDAAGKLVPGLTRNAFAASPAVALAEADTVLRTAMASRHIVEAATTPPPPPPPPPPPVETVSVTLEDRGNRTYWFRWTGITPAEYGLTSGRWNTGPVHDNGWQLTNALAVGYGELTDLPPGEAVYLVDTAGRRWEFVTGAAPPPVPPAVSVRVNVGGGAVATWVPETAVTVTGGSIVPLDSSLFVRAAANAAPIGTIGDGRSGSVTITAPNVPAGPVLIRFHFVDETSTAAGVRVTDIALNATPVVTGLDVFLQTQRRYTEYVQDVAFTNSAVGNVTVATTPTAGHTGAAATIIGIEFLYGDDAVTAVDPGQGGGPTEAPTPATAVTGIQQFADVNGNPRIVFTTDGALEKYALKNIWTSEPVTDSTIRTFELTYPGIQVGVQGTFVGYPWGGGTPFEYNFTPNAGTGSPWTAVTSGGPQANGSSTTITYPSLTAASSGGSQVYVGYAGVATTAVDGTTGGFTQKLLVGTGSATVTGPVTAGATVQPTGSCTPAGTSATMGIIIQGAGNGSAGATYLNDNSAAGLSTLSVTPTAIGKSMVVFVNVFALSPTVTGLSGGGVTTWNLITSGADATNRYYAFFGNVTTAGASTVTVSFSSAIGATGTEIVAYEVATVSVGGGGGGGGPITGQFTVSGSQILDPNGNPFVPVGCNLTGQWSYRPSSDVPTQGLSDWCLAWGFNIIRLVCHNDNLANSDTRNSDTAAIISEFTSKGIVVLLMYYGAQSGSYPASGPGSDLANQWTTWGNAYKNNPYVWFNLENEPGQETPVSSEWNTMTRNGLDAIRATGATNIVVCDGSAWGQDSWNGGDNFVQTYNSGILTYGPGIIADYDNVMFAFHAYDQWNASAAKMANYLDRVHAAGLAILVGEVGHEGYVDAVVNFRPALAAVYATCPPRGVGVIAWHGQCRRVLPTSDEGFNLVTTGERSISDINSLTNPTNLSESGAVMWALGHA